MNPTSSIRWSTLPCTLTSCGMMLAASGAQAMQSALAHGGVLSPLDLSPLAVVSTSGITNNENQQDVTTVGDIQIRFDETTAVTCRRLLSVRYRTGVFAVPGPARAGSIGVGSIRSEPRPV